MKEYAEISLGSFNYINGLRMSTNKHKCAKTDIGPEIRNRQKSVKYHIYYHVRGLLAFYCMRKNACIAKKIAFFGFFSPRTLNNIIKNEIFEYIRCSRPLCGLYF